MDKRITIGLVVAALALALGGWLYWQSTRPESPVVAEAPKPAAPAQPVEPAPPAPLPPAKPEVRHPIETQPTIPPSDGTPPPADGGGIRAALDDLLGSRAVLTFLQTDGLISRIVVTVDNLDREHAPPRLWPVNPTAGRFTTIRSATGHVIAAENAARYEPLVRFLESVDTSRAVALYVRLYPQFQQAYAALGYPRAYFNDRLIDVIDHLLAAPTPPQPVPVRPVDVKGPRTLERPWVHVQFADPGLESTTAGRKILARIGTDHALRLKAKLAEFRRSIATGTQSR